MIHSFWLVTTKPLAELRVAASLLRVYWPVSVMGDRRTLKVVMMSDEPVTVVTVLVVFDSTLPCCSELMKRAARVKSAELYGLLAQPGEAT